MPAQPAQGPARWPRATRRIWPARRRIQPCADRAAATTAKSDGSSAVEAADAAAAVVGPTSGRADRTARRSGPQYARARRMGLTAVSQVGLGSPGGRWTGTGAAASTWSWTRSAGSAPGRAGRWRRSRARPGRPVTRPCGGYRAWGPDDGRLSRPVLRAAGGETPLAASPGSGACVASCPDARERIICAYAAIGGAVHLRAGC